MKYRALGRQPFLKQNNMKIQNKMKFGIHIIIASLLFNLIETGYFGWNFTPSCHAEKVCDMVAIVGTYIGLIVFLIGLSELFDFD